MSAKATESIEPSDTRRRMVAAAADMIRRRGLNATSVRELAKHAQAPLGSTYHYFPGGKQQLVNEAIQLAGETIVSTLKKDLEAGPVQGLRAYMARWRKTIIRTDFQAGCPLLAVCVEDPSEAETAVALTAAGEVFRAWETALSDSLRRHGVDTGQAKRLATLVVASFEGSVALCRADRSTRPLDRISTQLEALLSTAIAPLSKKPAKR